MCIYMHVSVYRQEENKEPTPTDQNRKHDAGSQNLYPPTGGGAGGSLQKGIWAEGGEGGGAQKEGRK